MTVEARAAIPLWLLYEEEVEAWRKGQSEQVANWVGANHFKGEKHRVLSVPDAGGGVCMAVGGLGKRQGALSLWHAAGFAERLAPGTYRLAQSFGDAEATQIALGFGYGAYRFERYRPSRAERAAVLEPPHQRRHALRRLGKRGAHAGPRPHQYAGLGSRTRRDSRPPRAASPSAMERRFTSGWVRRCSPRTFRPFMRSGRGEHPGAALDRDPMVAPKRSRICRAAANRLDRERGVLRLRADSTSSRAPAWR